jgi:N-carbamoylputrescine amidase
MQSITFAAVQFSCSEDRDANIGTAERLIREAARAGAEVVVIPELFETPYFCATQNAAFYELARPMNGNATIEHFRGLAAELGLVIPISFYERSGPALYNAIALIDADGSVAGHYRKSHIPQSPGYEEKYYFSPGDTGFKAMRTAYGPAGLAICWDQWFPEAARCLALQGAEFLLYPTAIGSEPKYADLDSMEHWRVVMQGHAGANMMPVVAANRVGVETADGVEMTFYGSSFIADHTGRIVAAAGRSDEQVLLATFDLEVCRQFREMWGCFRDRRPDLYASITTLDGRTRPSAS